MRKTIKIKNYVGIFEEYEAHEEIRPGMLIELRSDGKVQKHGTEGGKVLPMFAVEDELQGNGIDDVYNADDQVQVWVPSRGDIVYGILKDDENVDVGDWLVSDGNGELQEATTFASYASFGDLEPGRVGQVVEAVDLSDSSGEWSDSRRRVKIRIY